MRHLKQFNELFEDLESSNVLNFSREDVKNRESYKDLIAAGFKDITPPKSGEGTFRFSHLAFDGMDYLIHTTGYIRRQNTNSTSHAWLGYKSMVTQSVIPPDIPRHGYRFPGVRAGKAPLNTSIIYGQPITSPEDYDIKFDWLKRILGKKTAKLAGVPYDQEADSEAIKNVLLKFAERSSNSALKVKLMFPKIWDEIKLLPGIKNTLIKSAEESPSSALNIKQNFPEEWNDIKSLPGMDTLIDLADIGF